MQMEPTSIHQSKTPTEVKTAGSSPWHYDTYPSIYPSVNNLSINPSILPSIHQSINPIFHSPFIHPPVHSSSYPSNYPSNHLSTICPQFIHPSIHSFISFCFLGVIWGRCLFKLTFDARWGKHCIGWQPFTMIEYI